MSKNFSDIAFRFLFSLIFIGLGSEHAFNDELIARLVPDWMHLPRLVSVVCGLLLVTGGSMIALGFRLKWAALMLGTFIALVTALVHAPALGTLAAPVFHEEDRWLWDTLQRSNFVKNLCLLGVCIMLSHYELGDWSLESYLQRRKTKER